MCLACNEVINLSAERFVLHEPTSRYHTTIVAGRSEAHLMSPASGTCVCVCVCSSHAAHVGFARASVSINHIAWSNQLCWVWKLYEPLDVWRCVYITLIVWECQRQSESATHNSWSTKKTEKIDLPTWLTHSQKTSQVWHVNCVIFLSSL